MIILPAIDLLDNKVVRLSQGEEKTAKIYSDNPLEMVEMFQDAGAEWIHVVNLDGAFGREGINDNTIREITKHSGTKIELGGGIRTLDQIGYWLNRRVSRVVIGSAALKNPQMIEKAVKKYGNEAIVIGIDMRDGNVAVHGWTDTTETKAVDLARQMKSVGISRLIITDIATDGMLTGPRLETMIEIAEQTELKIIASGGVAKMDDLTYIAEHSQIGIEGVIVGRAIYEKTIDIQAALKTFKRKTL